MVSTQFSQHQETAGCSNKPTIMRIIHPRRGRAAQACSADSPIFSRQCRFELTFIAAASFAISGSKLHVSLVFPTKL